MKIDVSQPLQLASTAQQKTAYTQLFNVQLQQASNSIQPSNVSHENPFQNSVNMSEEVDTWFIQEQEAMSYRTNDPNHLKQEVKDILEKAVQSEGFSHPKEFMKSLTSEERQALVKVNSYGHELSDAEIDSMSFEGAYNMLVPSYMRLDTDGNGLTAHGNGQTFKFPSSNAPESVKEAWASLTENMTSEEKLMAEAKMMTVYISRNLNAQMNGEGVDTFVDPFMEESFSYLDLARDSLAANEYFKGQMPEGQYERDKEFWTRFIEVFKQYSVA